MVSYNRAPWATIKRTHVGALEKGKQHEFVPITIKIPTFCDYCREIMIGKVVDYIDGIILVIAHRSGYAEAEYSMQDL